MDMYEKYREYGNSRPKLIFAGVVTALSIVYTLLVNLSAASRSEAASNLIYAVCYIPYTFIIAATIQRRSSFLANDINVTFKQPFHRSVTIQYKDIEEIIVYADRKAQSLLLSALDRGSYVETIAIRTSGGEYVFRGIEEAPYGGAMPGIAEEAPASGRFAALKKHIEDKKAPYINRNGTN